VKFGARGLKIFVVHNYNNNNKIIRKGSEQLTDRKKTIINIEGMNKSNTQAATVKNPMN
jgi:hypothetical protein